MANQWDTAWARKYQEARRKEAEARRQEREEEAKMRAGKRARVGEQEWAKFVEEEDRLWMRAKRVTGWRQKGKTEKEAEEEVDKEDEEKERKRKVEEDRVVLPVFETQEADMFLRLEEEEEVVDLEAEGWPGARSSWE